MYIYIHIGRILCIVCVWLITFVNSWRRLEWVYNTQQHSATRCNALQHAATRCNTLQHAATCAGLGGEGGYDSVGDSVLHCVAVWCSVFYSALQCVAACFGVCVSACDFLCVAVCSAMHCRVFQRVCFRVFERRPLSEEIRLKYWNLQIYQFSW